MEIRKEDFWHMPASKFKVYMYFRFQDRFFDVEDHKSFLALSQILRIPPDLTTKAVDELLKEGFISESFLAVEINELDII